LYRVNEIPYNLEKTAKKRGLADKSAGKTGKSTIPPSPLKGEYKITCLSSLVCDSGTRLRFSYEFAGQSSGLGCLALAGLAAEIVSTH